MMEGRKNTRTRRNWPFGSRGGRPPLSVLDQWPPATSSPEIPACGSSTRPCLRASAGLRPHGVIPCATKWTRSCPLPWSVESGPILMASSTVFSAPPTLLKTRSFQGLRPLRPTDAFPRAPTSSAKHPRGVSARPTGGRTGAVVRAELNPQVVISVSTGLSLFLGRFVFFGFQRENVAKQGLPKQNGVSHFEAGDVRAKEYVGILKSNDPVGFNIVDVLAWGSIGHIIAYYVLATSSNGYNPNFFG